MSGFKPQRLGASFDAGHGTKRAGVNDSGVALAKGDLVYVSGAQSPAGFPAVTKVSGGIVPSHVVYSGAPAKPSGFNSSHVTLIDWLLLSDVDTSAGAVGDAVYSDGAGGWTLTSAALPRVGTVRVVSATAGVIELNPGLFNAAPGLNAADPVLRTQTTLTAAQVKALNTTPIVLLAAPGAGKAIEVLGAVVSLDYGTAAYTSNAGEDLVIRYATSNDAVLVPLDDAQATVTEDALWKLVPDDLFLRLDINDGIEVACLVGNWAAGDSPITITLDYRIVDVV